MSQRSALVVVWAGLTSPARCRFCGQSIVWRMRRDTGKGLPFAPQAHSRGVHQDDAGRQFETLCWADVHHCAQRPKPTAPTRRARA